MDAEERDQLIGGGDPFREERHPPDTAAGRRRAKAEGTCAEHFPNEQQWTPSVYREHIAREQRDMEREK
jgi:hypothetical protein